jgi:heme/copper-type cytochrome/quinol oxidase subunit 3
LKFGDEPARAAFHAARTEVKRSAECIAPENCTATIKLWSSRRLCHAGYVDFLATEILFFGGLFLTYTINRHTYAQVLLSQAAPLIEVGRNQHRRLDRQ